MINLGSIQPFEIYNRFQSQGIFLCFVGPVSQGILEEVGDVLRARLESAEADTSKIQKVFSIFVEQVQNIISHSSEIVYEGRETASGEVRQGLLMVGRDGDSFFVVSGNYIMNDSVPALKSQLDRLRGMDKDEMKAYFKEMRRMEREDGAKGAGIGFIETARKASAPLEYEIIPGKGDMSFFSLLATIS